MATFFENLPKMLNLIMVLALSGATIGFGFIMICKLFKWAPVNITVNVNRNTIDGAE